MNMESVLKRVMAHSAMINVGEDDHHLKPDNIEISNTSLSVPPLPGGPAVWDVLVDYDATVVLFSLRSPNRTELSGGQAGVVGVATRSSIQASTCSLGGWRTIPQTSETAFYAKPSGALNLSHKVFTSSAQAVALSNAYLYETGGFRYFRTVWTNYGVASYTLDCRGEISVLG